MKKTIVLMKTAISTFLTFVLLFSSALLPVAAEGQFDDVTEQTSYADAIAECTDRGYTVGVGNRLFAPTRFITRAEVIAVLYRIADVRENSTAVTAFSDVPQDVWYASYVDWAYREQITFGCGGGVFAAQSLLTREQLAAMIVRFARRYHVNAEVGEISYTDQNDVFDFAQEEIAFCLKNEIMKTAKNGCFYPKEAVSRGELCEILLAIYDVCIAEKIMDVYLVAGQSNAAGFTYWNVDDEAIREYVDNSQAKTGYPNVYYYGCGSFELSEVQYGKVQFGQGKTSLMLGPEVGMAEALDAYYGNQKNKDVCIVKYAVGGTSLLEDADGEPDWYPPTMCARQLDASKRPNLGLLYRNMITVVKNAIAQFQKDGYAQICFRGLYWMQGEEDIWSIRLYKKVFPVFMSDLRKDLGKLFSQDLSETPILVGEISGTYLNADSDDVAFIEMQNQLTAALEGGYIVKNGSIPVGGLGSDMCHWGFFDMIAIGKTVGEMFLEIEESK